MQHVRHVYELTKKYKLLNKKKIKDNQSHYVLLQYKKSILATMFSHPKCMKQICRGLQRTKNSIQNFKIEKYLLELELPSVLDLIS